MNGDITRSTFHPKKHYNAVRMQQGRVQLDADWNEQVDIQNYFTQSLAKYVIGDSGVIRNSDSFKIFAAGQDADFTIAAGQMYVNGIICELEQNTTYKTQLDYPNPPQLSEDGFYLAYLDVWERDITALEDPEIREPALKGLDTATRTKIIWQVKLIPVPNINPQKPEINNWKFFADALNPNRKVYLKAATASSISEGNLVNPQKGYLGSENQLYRVEIHQSGDINQATFKWSRNNKITVSNVDSIKVNTIDISSVGRDDLLSFQPNQWVEIIDQEQELKNEPGVLLQLQKVSNKKLDVVGDPIETKFADKKHLQVIGWQEDQNTKKAEIAVSPNWIQLEKGIYIQFDSESTYKTGDYWLIPARAYTKDVDWPYDSSRQPRKQRSQGIKHYYSPLALLKYSNSSNNGTFTPLQDYRPTFPTLVNCLDKTGDTMTGDLEIQANLYVTNGGQVGIGTKDPKEKLHVDGNLRISNGTKLVNFAPQIDKWMQFTTNLDGYYFDQSIRLKDGVISSDEAANLALQTNGKTQLEIFNESGNVGIGVEVANEKLHVNGVVRIGTTARFLDIATGTDNLSHFKTNLNGFYFDKGIQIQNGGVRIGTTDSFLDIATGTDNLSRFQTNLDGYSFDKGIQIQNGVVRIGTTASFLDIATGTDNLSRFQTNLDGYSFDKGIQIQNGVVRIGTTESFLDIATGTDNLSRFQTNLDGYSFDKGIQIQNGVVRIGTTESFLDIATGTDNLSRFQTNLDGYSFDKGIQIQSGVISSDANNLLLQTNGITQMILTTGGNVTIGNTLPASDAKLYVAGNLRINGRIFQDSSRELKENITDLSSQEVTEILRTIKPIKFNYKNSVDKDIHAGFLSENVPSLLTSPDNTAISPVDIVAVLTKAVKDQDIKISLLLNALRDQRTQIATLMDKVRMLESKE
ncbi:DUF6519 domain-containing protein [Anabaena azotica]|uniref:DUF6519 domain-containing protein n=1 Tax=Anabaena azotica TaxID=197653 RepID=UPI0039A54951